MTPAIFSWLRLLALCAMVGVPTVAGYFFGLTVKENEWNTAKVAESDGRDAALRAAAKAIAKIEVKSATYIQPVRTEIQSNPVYRDCQHSADSLRNLNALITGDEPAGGSSMPASDAAR
jgi:hypothetical protein